MRKILIPALLFIFVFATVKAGELASIATGKYIFQVQTLSARLNSSARLFSLKYDLTSVILVIPSGTLVSVLGSDSTYYRVKYGEDEGFIYRKDATLIADEVPAGKPVTSQPVEKPAQTIDKKTDRQTYLAGKYGPSVATKMLAGKIWKGMTAEMVSDSWGTPLKINRTINSTVTREEWIYKNSWLFIENNTLVEWGPVNR